MVDDIKYTSPSTPANAYIAEHFDDDERFSKRWIKSEAKKEDTDDTIAKYDGWFVFSFFSFLIHF